MFCCVKQLYLTVSLQACHCFISESHNGTKNIAHICLSQLGPRCSVEYWETLLSCRGEQDESLYLGIKSWENASELRREPGLQLCSLAPPLLREPDPGHVRPHLKHTLIQHTEQLRT